MVLDRRKNYLNEELKRREEEELTRKQGADKDAPMKLDDTQRVKVLSPGRLVAKRFFRNKLALVGLGVLIFMFLFAFLFPVFYPYDQTDIFYKKDYLTINYAAANQRTDYTSYVLDPAVDIHYSVKNKMTSYINKMTEEGLTELAVTDDNGLEYTILSKGEGVYCLTMTETELVGTHAGAGTVAEVNRMSGEITMKDGSEAPVGAQDAAKAAIKDGSMTFELDGSVYTLNPGPNKKTLYLVCESGESIVYESEEPGEGFTDACLAAVESGEPSLEFGGERYLIEGDADNFSVLKLGEQRNVMVSSVFVFDAFEKSASFSDSFKASALMALYGEGSFEADGKTYEIRTEEDTSLIYDDAGSEVAMISDFVVRRYSGDDTLSVEFKQKAAEVVAEMVESDSRSSSFTFELPLMDEEGNYVLDENGEMTYSESELSVTRKVDQYVIRCDQITNLIDIYAEPSAEHLFGTDSDGMDILARMMYGGRISLMVGFVVVILESVLGVIMGGLAGFFGGWVDNLIMRLVDIFYCIPTYPILIIMGAFFDAVRMGSYQRLIWMMAVLGVLGWAGVARLVRGQILSLREQEFMVAAEATGIRASRRIFRHLIPNVMPQLIVSATMGLGGVILTESTLSFLGLGVKRPLATWGTMINAISSSNENLLRYAHIWIPVGLLICLTVIAFNFVGDGLRDAFDPKMKQ